MSTIPIEKIELDEEDNSSNSFNSYGEKRWPWIDGEAYHGLVGEIVETIEPHSEADPVALLVRRLLPLATSWAGIATTRLRATVTTRTYSPS